MGILDFKINTLMLSIYGLEVVKKPQFIVNHNQVTHFKNSLHKPKTIIMKQKLGKFPTMKLRL